MIQYKTAEFCDIDVIFALNKENIDKYEDVEKLNYDKVLEWVKKKIHDNISSYKVIYYDENKAGYFYFHEVDSKYEIDDLYIIEQYRNKGIGTKVINDCIEKSKEKGLPIFLYVFSRNTGAVSLYSRLGFEITENIKDTRYIMERGV